MSDRITKLDAMTREQRIEWANNVVRLVLAARAAIKASEVDGRLVGEEYAELHDATEALWGAL
jgi:hypothetical protein